MSQTSPKRWKLVCKADEMHPNIGICAQIDGQQIALFKVDDRIYAIDNHDPFSGSNVLSRGIVGDLQDKLCVASPIFKQHFALETGECLEDESVTLNTHRATEIDGAIYVSAGH